MHNQYIDCNTSSKVTPVLAMKAYVKMEPEFHTLLTSALHVVVSLTRYHFSPGEKSIAHTEYETGGTPEIV